MKNYPKNNNAERGSVRSHAKPVLFLDFDRTLFDTDKFYEWLGPDRFPRILAFTAGSLGNPDFSMFLYSDAVGFLRHARKTHRVVILTYAQNVVLQRRKLRCTGVVPLVDDVIITSVGSGGETGKGEHAREYLYRIGDPGWEHTFVDDAPQNIDEVRRWNPEIRCIRIDRSTQEPGSLENGLLPPHHVVRDLAGLVHIL